VGTKFIHTYVSVDCVVFGFDDDQLNVLLVQLRPDEIEDKRLNNMPYVVPLNERQTHRWHTAQRRITGSTGLHVINGK
jgi:hypothetical protein